MSQPLPTGKFRFLTSDEIRNFRLESIAPDAPKGYFIDCDLDYPEELHQLHNQYPMAPEHLTVSESMLSSYAKSFDNRSKPTKKLVPNLMNKKNYVCHYRNLQLYVRHGLKV